MEDPSGTPAETLEAQPAAQTRETVLFMERDTPTSKTYVRVRGVNGQFLPVDPDGPAALNRAKRKAQAKQRFILTERDYLKTMARALETEDVHNVVVSVVRDAIDGEEKCRNAAREWLGKYALGGGKQSLDLILHPEVIAGKR